MISWNKIVYANSLSTPLAREPHADLNWLVVIYSDLAYCDDTFLLSGTSDCMTREVVPASVSLTGREMWLIHEGVFVL